MKRVENDVGTGVVGGEALTEREFERGRREEGGVVGSEAYGTENLQKCVGG